MKKKTGTAFRSWLIERLAESKFVTYLDDTDEEVAARLGVRMDVLKEAKERFRRRAKDQGLDPDLQRFGYKVVYGGESIYGCYIEPPQQIYEAWEALRDARKASDSSLFRGVVHAVLQVRTQPAWLSKQKINSWIWQGQWIGQVNIRAHNYRLACKISERASHALRERAIATHVKPSAITRWGVNLFVCGKLQAQVVTSPFAMYKDEQQYCVNPQIT